MVLVNWTPDSVGGFVKAIEAAKAAGSDVFTFDVPTAQGLQELEFNIEYAQHLADYLTDSFATGSLQ